MAKSVLDILIKLSKQGNADKETITGLVKLKSSFMDAAAVAGTLVAAGYAVKKVFDETVGTMVAYADQVRAVQQSTGMSAEESSKLIQVLDDMKVSYDELQKVIQKNGDQFDYSVAGLAKMSDEYRSLTDAQEKAKFMQERFGKGWVSFVETMEQGGSRIRAAGDGISDALILDQKALDQAREYEKNLDNLSDAFTAIKVSIGNELLPVLNDLIQAHISLNRENENSLRIQKELLAITGLNWTQYQHLSDAEKAAYESQARLNISVRDGNSDAERMVSVNKYAAQAVRDTGIAAAETAAALEETQKKIESLNSAQLSATGSMQSNFESYNESYQQISTDMTLTDDERIAKLDELTAQHELDSKKIVLSMLTQQLAADGLQSHELDALLNLGVSWGVYSQKVVDETRKAMVQAELLKKKIDDIPTQKAFKLTMSYQNNLGSYYSNLNNGYATGTDGWETVPSGYPNDSYPVFLTSGEKFAVIPANGGGGVNMSGAGGGSPVIVNFTYAPGIGTADPAQVEQLTPIITNIVRRAYIGGQLGG
jgi:hypothetical protein